MRTSAALAILVILILSAAAIPPAEAHEDGVGHGSLFTGLLPRAETLTRHLDFEGGPLHGGWVFLLVAKVFGAPLQATLSVEGASAASWTIPTAAETRWAGTTVLPRDGVYELSLTNSGAVNASFAIYFDQSCNCVGKFIPAEIPDGMIIFNKDVTGPGTVFAQFNEPKAMRVRVTAALLVNSRGLWPADFAVLAVSNAPVQRQVKPELPPVWLHELRVEVDRPTRVYYILEGISFDATKYSGPQDLFVTPFYEASARADSGLSPWILAAVLAVFVAFAVILVRRGRRLRTAEKLDSKKSVRRRGGGRGGGRARTSRRRRR